MIYENIDEFLKSYDSDMIVFCVGNYAVRHMILNLWISAKQQGVDVVVFALDEKLTSSFGDKCNVVKYYDSTMKFSRQSFQFRTEDFSQIVYHRYFIGNEILYVNKRYVYMDVDIVVKKNFIGELNEYYEDGYEALFQHSNGKPRRACCTGFFSMRPTSTTLDFYTKEMLIENHAYDVKQYTCDQDFFNKHIWHKFKKYRKMNIKLLSSDLYPTGSYYRDNVERVDDICNIIHFNWNVGGTAKLEELKKYGYWYLEQ